MSSSKLNPKKVISKLKELASSSVDSATDLTKLQSISQELTKINELVKKVTNKVVVRDLNKEAELLKVVELITVLAAHRTEDPSSDLDEILQIGNDALAKYSGK